MQEVCMEARLNKKMISQDCCAFTGTSWSMETDMGKAEIW